MCERRVATALDSKESLIVATPEDLRYLVGTGRAQAKDLSSSDIGEYQYALMVLDPDSRQEILYQYIHAGDYQAKAKHHAIPISSQETEEALQNQSILALDQGGGTSQKTTLTADE